MKTVIRYFFSYVLYEMSVSHLMVYRLVSLLLLHEPSLPLKRWTFLNESRTLSCRICRQLAALPVNSDPNRLTLLSHHVMLPAWKVLVLSSSSRLFAHLVWLSYWINSLNWFESCCEIVLGCVCFSWIPQQSRVSFALNWADWVHQ